MTKYGPQVYFHVLWSTGIDESISVLNDSWLNTLSLNLSPTFINMEVN